MGGATGVALERLLSRAREQGARVLADVTRRAVERAIVRGGGHLDSGTLFDADERQEVAEMLAAVTGTANLLGRARVRRRQAEVLAGVAKHAEAFCGGKGGKPGPCPEGGGDAGGGGLVPHARPNPDLPDESRVPVTPKAKEAVQGYTEEDDGDLNVKLRRGGELTGRAAEVHQELQGLFEQAKPFPAPVTAYRGVSFRRGEGEKFRGMLKEAAGTGKALEFDGYSSSTTDPGVAAKMGNAGVLFEIQAVKGLDLSSHSTRPSEKELLLDTKSKFLVDSVEEQPGGKLRVKMRQVLGSASAEPPPPGPPRDFKAGGRFVDEGIGHIRLVPAPAPPRGRAPAGRWGRFDEGESLRPLAPERAAEYFRGLVPSLGVDPQRFGADQRRRAFTLAAATEQQVVGKVQAALQEAIDEGVADPRAAVEQALDAAGVSPKNPQYADMVTRTNLADAYTTGLHEEMQDPDVAPWFPAWRYDTVVDGRRRPEHAAHHGKYFANAVPFAAVRDSLTGGYSGFNCRCVASEISLPEWEKLQAEGVTLEPFP